MTDYVIRPFSSAAAIRRVGNGLLDRSLPKPEWTHEAHLASCVWLLLERPGIVPEVALPGIIRAYNVATGGVNDDTQGYHETLTQLYIRGVRVFITKSAGGGLLKTVNGLLASDLGRPDWPLSFYSQSRLFSVTARREWIEPDFAAI
jgi:hypothetical protein